MAVCRMKKKVKLCERKAKNMFPKWLSLLSQYFNPGLMCAYPWLWKRTLKSLSSSTWHFFVCKISPNSCWDTNVISLDPLHCPNFPHPQSAYDLPRRFISANNIFPICAGLLETITPACGLLRKSDLQKHSSFKKTILLKFFSLGR